MARHAIVNKEGTVVNVVIWEGAQWLPPKDHYVVQHDQANIGDKYDFQSNSFSTPKSS
jgi:hypothetical protein